MTNYHTMKKLLPLIMLLTACATPNERRQGLPDINVPSNKPSKEVALCIADKWENIRPFLVFSSLSINTSIKTNGYTVTGTGSGSTNTIVLVDILDYQQGSYIKYYKMGGGGFGDYDEVVKQCQ